MYKMTITGADLGILEGGGGGGVSGPEFFKGGGFRVQVRGNFHILTSKKTTSGGLNPLTMHPLDPPLHNDSTENANNDNTTDGICYTIVIVVHHYYYNIMVIIK